MVVRDKIHLDLSKPLGYHVDLKIVISPRSCGKSTDFWNFAYKKYRQGLHTLVIRRQPVCITTTYIKDIERSINKFARRPINLCFNKGDCKEGIVDVYVGDDIRDKKKKLFFRVIAASLPTDRVKSSAIDKLCAILFDEFILNTRQGEKYLLNEVFRYKEIYTTYIREAVGEVQCFFFGNPYSLYNPYFAWLHIPVQEIHEGCFLTGKVDGFSWLLWCFKMSDELKAFIQAQNPLTKIEDEYTKYAFDGRAINDQNIVIIEKQPQNFKQRFIFKLEKQKYMIVYGFDYFKEDGQSITEKLLARIAKYDYWCEIVQEVQTSQTIACFDFQAIEDGTYLLRPSDRAQYTNMLNAFRFHKIAFKTLEAGYLMEYIYEQL